MDKSLLSNTSTYNKNDTYKDSKIITSDILLIIGFVCIAVFLFLRFIKFCVKK